MATTTQDRARCRTHRRSMDIEWVAGQPEGCFIRGHWHVDGECRKWDGVRPGQPLACRDCGRELERYQVKATTVSAISCDTRCKVAEGGTCRCSCGGRQHGKEAA